MEKVLSPNGIENAPHQTGEEKSSSGATGLTSKRPNAILTIQQALHILLATS
jgi:hypothetical protein